MASDSRLTLNVSTPVVPNNAIPFSDTTQKIFICPNNCGISTCGNASYNNKPIAGFINQFISGISEKTLVSEIPQMLIKFFNNLNSNGTTIFQAIDKTV